MRAPAKFGLAALLLAIATLPAAAQTRSVNDSAHNLSLGTANPGGCAFCHAPHSTNVVAPLWNHQLSPDPTKYTPYTSSTYAQANEPVSTRSKLCLSCHDGTVALGQTIAFGPLETTAALSPRTNLGANLATDHPFEFTMPAVDDGEIRLSLTTASPTTPDSSVRLYSNKIECITCHDPHVPNNDAVVQKFLVRDNANGAICNACHDSSRGALAGWAVSSHATAQNAAAASAGPYGSVAMNACMNCHGSHNAAGSGQRLLRGVEETACTTCHSTAANVSPAARNVMSQVTNSLYSHPITTVSGEHDPAESLPVNKARHSECADCHNPHAAQVTGTTTPPALQAALAGASGVSAADGVTPLPRAANEYEVCLKCHANSTNKPQNAAYTNYGRTPYRQTFALAADPFNVRVDFQSSVARHSVTQPAGGRGQVSPSLRANMLDLAGNPTGRLLQAGTYIYCTDCHNNNDARSSGGASSNGPHGSNWEHLLERRYQANEIPAGGTGSDFPKITYSPGVAGPYALCDKCHDVNNQILTGDRVFGKHDKHVNGTGASCSTCHAPHGIQGGSATNNKHLINFDLNIVGPNRSGQLLLDGVARTCSLECHGKNHAATKY